jgi:hypothetical protein
MSLELQQRQGISMDDNDGDMTDDEFVALNTAFHLMHLQGAWEAIDVARAILRRHVDLSEDAPISGLRRLIEAQEHIEKLIYMHKGVLNNGRVAQKEDGQTVIPFPKQ